VIEGDAQTMWNSLLKLRELPDDAKVFCGHEYTRSNIRFAMTIEKDNQALVQRSAEVDQLLAKGLPSIPMIMNVEKAANPFLRADLPAMAQAVGLPGAPAWQVFAEIRARKDRF
jgi:hydroxyacylglutathione hydrolase